MPSRQSNEGSLDPVFVMGVLQTHGFQPIYEQEFGHGYAIAVGHEPAPVKIGVFPAVNSVEIVSGTSILRLDNVHRIRRRGQQLHLEALEGDERVSIDISSEGGFTLRRQPLIAPETDVADDETVEGSPAPTPVPVAETPVTVAKARAQRTHKTRETPPPAAESPEAADPARVPARHDTPVKKTEPAQQLVEQNQREQGERENARVTLRGRVGKEVHFRTTARRGVLVASFPLGEHPDLETTLWHSIVVFGDRAQKLQEKGLTVGQEIEVVGYAHERVVQRQKSEQTGEQKRLTEIYATAIRTTLRKPPGSSGA